MCALCIPKSAANVIEIRFGMALLVQNHNSRNTFLPLQEISLDLYLYNSTAQQAECLWSALASLSNLRTCALGCPSASGGPSRDLLFKSFSLMSHIR